MGRKLRWVIDDSDDKIIDKNIVLSKLSNAETFDDEVETSTIAPEDENSTAVLCHNEVECYIRSFNWDCTWNPEILSLSGSMLMNCTVDTKENETNTMELINYRDPHLLYMDKKCNNQHVVNLIRKGKKVCVKQMVDDYNYKILYKPLSYNLIRNKMKKANHRFDNYEMDDNFDSVVFYNVTTGVKFEVIESRTDVNEGGIYTTPDGFVTQWNIDRTETDSNFESGALYLAETDLLDPNCDRNNQRFRYFTCGHSRKFAGVCEGNTYASGMPGGDVYSCLQRTNPDIYPDFMRQELATGISRSGNLARTEDRGTIDAEIRSDDGCDNQANVRRSSARIRGDISYLKIDQDADQQAGNVKYFLFNIVASIEVLSGNLAQVMMDGHYNFNGYGTGLRSTLFPEDAIPAVPIEDMDPYRHVTGQTQRHCLDWNPFFSVSRFQRPTSNAMWQDRLAYSMVFKFDLFSNGMVANATNYEAFEQNCERNSNGNCIMTMATYYAIRAYAPFEGYVRFLGTEIERITVIDGICPGKNQVKIKDVCYEPDFETINTDAVAGGYPLNGRTLLISRTWNPNNNYGFEQLWFYLAHPKVGGGVYQSQVSYAGSIGNFNTRQRCVDSYSDSQGNPMCDGYPSFNIPLVEVTTFHSSLLEEPDCSLGNSTLNCRFVSNQRISRCTVNRPNDTEHCDFFVSDRASLDLNDKDTKYLRFPSDAIMLHKGVSVCDNCLFNQLRESYYRCTFCVVILLLITGMGIWLFAIFLVFVLLFFLNSYSLGILFRKMKLNCCFKNKKVQKCRFCCMEMYNIDEKNKHDWSCPKNCCPYCLRLKPDGNYVNSYQRKFGSRKMLVEHMKKHRWFRINKLIGLINLNRGKVVLFSYILLSRFSPLESRLIDEESGLRNANIGQNLTFDNRYFTCSDSLCTITGDVNVRIPIIHGASFVMSTQNSEGENFMRKVTIMNPRIRTTCGYEYTSSGFRVFTRRTNYKCQGTQSCSDLTHSFLTTPLAGSNDDKYIVYDRQNPLQDYYCPKDIACQSPLTRFFWLSIGCFTVNDGVMGGYQSYTPLVTDNLLSVFHCEYKALSYDVCFDDDENNCVTVSSDDDGIRDGNIDFEEVDAPIEKTFRISAMIRQGENVPSGLFYNPPERTEITSTGFYQYRMIDVPQTETCLSETVKSPGFCTINTAVNHPSLNCRDSNLIMDVNVAGNSLSKLFNHINCNLDDTRLEWDNNVIRRSISIGSGSYEDYQPSSRPMMHLDMKWCNFGMRNIQLRKLKDVTLEIERFSGDIDNIECSGEYNRNNKAMLTVNSNRASYMTGYMKLDCGDHTSGSCVMQLSNTKSCNTTIMLNSWIKCNYNDKVIDVDCTGLLLSEPDLASSTISSGTGSSKTDTWISGFNLAISTWWGILLIVLGCIVVLIAIIWMFMCCCNCKKSMRYDSNMTKKFAAPKDYKIVDDEYTGEKRTLSSYDIIKGYNSKNR